MKNWWNLLGACVAIFATTVTPNVVWKGLTLAIFVFNAGIFLAANIQGKNL